MLTRIANNRFSHDIADDSPSSLAAAREKVRALTLKGPLTAQEAVDAGLLTGFAYKGELIESLLGMDRDKVDPEKDDPAERVEKLQEKAEKNLRGFYHYAKVKEKELAKAKKDTLEVGVVYVLGTIGDVGECAVSFAASSRRADIRAHQVRDRLDRPRAAGGGRGRQHRRRHPQDRHGRRRRHRERHDLGRGQRPEEQGQDCRLVVWQRRGQRRLPHRDPFRPHRRRWCVCRSFICLDVD